MRLCDLRECEAFVILPVNRGVRLYAAVGGEMQVAVPNTCPSPRSLGETASISVLAQRFVCELVLAHDALGVDPQEDVHAVPSPLGYLSARDHPARKDMTQVT